MSPPPVLSDARPRARWSTSSPPPVLPSNVPSTPTIVTLPPADWMRTL
jgi:hypothetical protein